MDKNDNANYCLSQENMACTATTERMEQPASYIFPAYQIL